MKNIAKIILSIFCMCAFVFFAFDHAKDGEYWSMMTMLVFVFYSGYLIIGSVFEFLFDDLIRLRDRLRSWGLGNG